MRNPREMTRRWLAQAEHSHRTARVLLENGFWAETCFHAEQTSQLALKAYLYSRGRRFINIYSVRTLVMECGREDAEFLKLEDYGKVLDRYYLTTRYPDALPDPAIPFESFTELEARQAETFSNEIVELVKTKVAPILEG